MSVADSTQSRRRTRLIEAAVPLFARWGFDKTSVDDIARETGISKGAVYLEFPNKEALFRAVLHQEFANYAKEWLQRFEQDPGEWSFAQMFQHSIAVVNANPFVKAVLTRDQRFLGNSLFADKELLRQTIAARSAIFLQMQEVGAMRDDIPAPVMAYLMSALSYGLIAGAETIPEEHRIPFDEALRGFGLLLDRGLAPEHGHNRQAARALILTAVEKMQAVLNAEPLPSPEEKT